MPGDTSALCFESKVNNIGHRHGAIVDMNVEPFVCELFDSRKTLVLIRSTTPYPDLHSLKVAACLACTESVDDAAEGRLHIGEVCNGTTYNDMLDVGELADGFCKCFNSPVGRITGIFGIICDCAATGNNCI